ncbi:helix-turn-helix domain-containing protein [Microbispora sp. NEAU-D428]|nr:helix-turn-helix domain-containing protein [Microbispora sitophila]
MRTSEKVRVYPTSEQAAVLNRTFGCVRLVWNTVLARWTTRSRSCGPGPRSTPPIDPATVTVSRDSDGRWYASLAVETETGPEPLPATGDEAGADLGVSDFAVLSAGEKIPNPCHLERKARNLARSAGWPASSVGRTTGPGRRSPAPTPRCGTPVPTSCTARPRGWSVTTT